MNAQGRAIIAGVDRLGPLHRESAASILAFVLVLLCATDRLAAQFTQSELVVRRCTIRGSSAVEGGGVFATGATVRIENSVMVGNTATDGAGGAVHAENASVIVRNATVAENEASGGSGGVWHSGLGTVNVDNCILWRNAIGGNPLSAAAQIDGIGGSSAITVAYSCVQDDEIDDSGVLGTGNIDSDPLFTQAPNPGANGWGDSDDQFGRLTLGTESPCLDAGDESLVVTGETDLAGGGRVWRDSVDMGAYEAGRVVYVDGEADAGGNGYSWATAFDDLQDALDVSRVGTEIWVVEGTYIPTEPTDPPPSPDPRSVSFNLPDGVSAYGGFRGTEHRRSQRNISRHPTILSGDINADDDVPGGGTSDNAYTVVTATDLSAPTVLDGFDIVGGHGGIGGGGIRTESSNLLIDNCRIIENSADSGGGMHASGTGPSLTVRRCTLLRNVATSCAGGGIHNTAAASFEQTYFHGNSAFEAGGGVYTEAPVDVNIENSVFVGNQSLASGAVHHASEGSLTITNCTITANISTEDEPSDVSGGIYSEFAGLGVVNTILWGNRTAAARTLDAQQVDGPESISVTHSIVEDDDVSAQESRYFFLKPGTLVPENCYCTTNRDYDPRFVSVPIPATGSWGDADDDYGNLRLAGHSLLIDFELADSNIVLRSDTDISGAPRRYSRNLGGQTECTPDPSTPEDIGVIDAGAHEAPGALCVIGYQIGSTTTDGGAFSRFNLQLNQVFGPGDYPPRTTDAALGSSPLVSKESSYFQGPTPRPERPLHNDVLDLITGRPLIQETDFELPFGGAVFRHTRTYGESVADHGVGETNQHGAFWDWNGLNWMMSENPILLVDGHFPHINYEGTTTSGMYDAPRCYLIPDAHHAIPFIFDKAIGEYTSPPWFDAVLAHNGAFDTNTFQWLRRPTQFHAWLQHGAILYTFDVDMSEPVEQAVEHTGLTHTPLCELEPRGVVVACGSSPQEEEFNPAAWCENDDHLFEDYLQDDSDVFSCIAQLFQAGVPYLAYVTRISDRYGNAVEYEYCPPTGADVCSFLGTDPNTCEQCSNCGERGQINAIRLRAAPEGGQRVGKVVWTLAYTHRSLPFDDLNAVLDDGKHPHHLLHSIHVYEGDVEVPEGCRTIGASYFDISVPMDSATTRANIDAIDATTTATSGIYPPVPGHWRYRVQYMYSDVLAGGALNNAVPDTGSTYGHLVKVDVAERSTNDAGAEVVSHAYRMYRYGSPDAGVDPSLLSNRYTLTHLFGPQTIDSIMKGIQLENPGTSVDENELFDLPSHNSGSEVTYLDPERLDCACCAQSEEVQPPDCDDCATCSSALQEEELGNLADMAFAERSREAFLNNNLAVSSRYSGTGKPVAVPEGKKFWIAEAGKKRFIDRRKGRSDGGEFLIYNGYVVEKARSPNLIPEEELDTAWWTWVERVRPGLFHWPYRYWWFDQDESSEQDRDGEYVEPQRGEVFWVTIVERLGAPDGFEDKEAPEGLCGAGPENEDLAKIARTRIVEMDVAGFVIRDRTWSTSCGVTQEGFAESFLYDNHGRIIEQRSKGTDVDGASANEGLVTVFEYDEFQNCLPGAYFCKPGELKAVGIKKGIGGPTDPVYYTRRYERLPGRPDLITKEVVFPEPVTDPESTSGDVTQYDYIRAVVQSESGEVGYPVVRRTVTSPAAAFDEDHPDAVAVVVTATDGKGNICCSGMGTQDGASGPFLEFYFDVNEYDDKGRPTTQIVDAEDPGMCPEDFDFQRVSSTDPLNLTTQNYYDPVFGLIRTTRRDNLGVLVSDSRIQYIEDHANGALEQWIYKDIEQNGGQYFYRSPVQITRFEMGKIAWTKQVDLTVTTPPPHTHDDYEPITAATPTYDETGRISGVARSQDVTGNVTTADTYSRISYASSGQISRQREASGTITRHVYDQRGRLLRTYRGTLDDHEVWGTAEPGSGDAGDNLVLVEKRYYGAGVTNADLLTEIRHYRQKPANQYFFVGEGVPENNEESLGWLERFEYDWRMRAVWAQTNDGDGDPIRHTLTWYDHLDRARFTAEYGVAAPAAGSAADPRALGESSVLPDAGDILSNAVKPLSLTETIYNGRGLVEETRVYDVSDADGDVYTWTRTHYNHTGKPTQTLASNGPSQRFTYDARGRQVRRVSHVGAVELSDARTVYDANDNPTRVVSRTRKHDASSDALTDSNSVTTWHYSWYDLGKRLLATADYGTGGDTYESASPAVEPLDYDSDDPPARYDGPEANAPLLDCDGLGFGPRTTCYEYDEGGRVKTVIQPNGAKTRTEYDALGRVLLTLENDHENTETPANPIRRTAYKYDDRGRLSHIAAVLPDPGTGVGANTYAEVDWSQGYTVQVTELEYDAAVIDAAGAAISGNADWVSTVRFPDRLTGLPGTENILTITYTPDGLPATRTDGNGSTLTFTYDELGRLETASSEAGEGVADGFSDLEFSYSDFGLELAKSCHTVEQVPCQIDLFSYDARANLIETWIGHAQSGYPLRGIFYNRDSPTDFSRLSWIAYPARGPNQYNTFVTYWYGDTLGDIDDILGRITRISHVSHGTLAEYSYAGSSMRVGTTLGNGIVSQSVAGGAGYTGLDGFGRLIDLEYLNESLEVIHRYEYGYDTSGNRLFARVTQAAEPGSPPVEHVNDRSWHYQYDKLNRLVKAERGALNQWNTAVLGQGASGAVERVKIDWLMDSVGNWSADGFSFGGDSESVVLSTGEADTGSGGGAYEAVATVHHEARYDNRLAWITTGDGGSPASQTSTTIETDANGNLTNDGVATYQYDVFNRLVRRTSPTEDVSLVYDAFGRLVTRTVNRGGVVHISDYYYDGVRRIQEWVSDGGAPFALDREYIYGPDYVDEHLVQIVPGDFNALPDPIPDQLVYTLQDANYNVVALLDDAGSVLHQYNWSPYGQLTDSDELAPHPENRIGHQGLFWLSFGVDSVDPNGELSDDLYPPLPQYADQFFRTDLNGAFFSRARFYSPHLGRFLTPDPNETALPLLTAAYMNGQTAMASLGLFNAEALYADGMNLYAAYGSNPLLNRDAMGLAYNAYEDAIDEQIDYLVGYRLYALGAINEGARAASIGLNLALDIAASLLGADVFQSIQVVANGGGGFWEALDVVSAITPFAGPLRAINKAAGFARRAAKGASAVGKVVKRIKHHVIPNQIWKLLDAKSRKKIEQIGGSNLWEIPEDLHKRLHGAVGDGYRNSGSYLRYGGGAYNARWRAEIHALGRRINRIEPEELIAIRDRIVRDFDLDSFRR